MGVKFCSDGLSSTHTHTHTSNVIRQISVMNSQPVTTVTRLMKAAFKDSGIVKLM